tara:strand:- start:867 stop:2411 length:1545 start_codon:yes stop_codon:yes gene_type:complete
MFKIIFSYFRYLNFNKKFFKNDNKTNNIILAEFPNLKSFAISSSYFCHTLNEIHNAKTFLYFPNFLTFKDKLKYIFSLFNPFSTINIFKSFTKKIIIPNQKLLSTEKEKKLEKYSKKIRNKWDLINLKYKNIQIGDLLYDEYLARFNVPTVEIESEHFKNFLSDSIKLLFFWEDFLSENNVKSLVLSHSVYIMGLVGRVGIAKDINVYVVAPTSHYKLSKKQFIKWSDHMDYNHQFKKMKKNQQKYLLSQANKNIELRLSGKEDLRYKLARPMTSVFKGKQIKKKSKMKLKKINILVAAHCFMDAPHVFGSLIFEDFFEWIYYLGKKSKDLKFKKKYKWFIKIHPSLYSRNKIHFENFIEKYPNFTLVGKNETHNNLINKIGIDYVLTVYGSIAHEYPLFGIPVINAGFNPHQGYNFSKTVNSIKDYDKILSNLPKYKLKRDYKKEILEFYAMHHLIDYNFFEDLKIDFNLGLSDKLDVLCQFVNKTDNKIHNKKIDIYKRFIYSKERRLIKIN